jgi:hypothetical protein
MERRQANEEDKNVEGWGWIGIWKGVIRFDVSSRQDVGLAPMRDAHAQIKEILEPVGGAEEQGVVWIGLMQNRPAYADDTPGKCGEYQERHDIDAKALVYIGFGMTARFDIVICREATFLCAQGMTPFQDDGIATSMQLAHYRKY